MPRLSLFTFLKALGLAIFPTETDFLVPVELHVNSYAFFRLFSVVTFLASEAIRSLRHAFVKEASLIGIKNISGL